MSIVVPAGVLAIACAVNGAPNGNPLAGLATLERHQAMRSSSSDPNWVDGNADARPIAPGETLVIADLEGPGEITHIWNTVSSPERGYSRLLVLRMYWDGEQSPSVEVPLGDFFGIGHGLDVSYESIPVRVTSEGRARNCYWPMPFRESARITVTNEGRLPTRAFYYQVDWRKLSRLPRDTAYFHAQYRQEHPAVMGRNYLLADIVGRGHYVGTVLSWRQRQPAWPGEGDDFFFVDGEAEPSLRGTGTEDYFGDAWGFRRQAGAWIGAPLVEGRDVGSRMSAYRWHVPDPVPFRRSLRVEIEHKGVTFDPDGSVRSGFEERADDFSSVAFWYQTEPHEPFPALPAGYARMNYDFAELVAGDTLIPRATATAGRIEPQTLGPVTQLWWRPATEGETLTVPIEVAETGRYEVRLLVTTSFDYGIYQPELDGEPLGGPVDLHTRGIEERELIFREQRLQAGEHTLTFRNRGKNPASGGYFFGLRGVVLHERSLGDPDGPAGARTGRSMRARLPPRLHAEATGTR